MKFKVQYAIPGTPLGSRAVAMSLHALLGNIAPLSEHASRLELAITEVMNNVAIHSYSNDQDGEMLVQAEFDGKAIKITIRDRGTGPKLEEIVEKFNLPKAGQKNSNLPQSGRGLFIISQIMDNVEYDKVGEENQVQMTKEIT